jgi:hypothetical protein
MLHWGHKVASREGPVEVTRLEYNQQAGAETPEQPEIPACGQHVWDWWWELNARRAPGFDSTVPLSYTEICSWLVLTRRLVTPEEIGWLIAMDDRWLNTIADERKAKSERDKPPDTPTKPKRTRKR